MAWGRKRQEREAAERERRRRETADRNRQLLESWPTRVVQLFGRHGKFFHAYPDVARATAPEIDVLRWPAGGVMRSDWATATFGGVTFGFRHAERSIMIGRLDGTPRAPDPSDVAELAAKHGLDDRTLVVATICGVIDNDTYIAGPRVFEKVDEGLQALASDWGIQQLEMDRVFYFAHECTKRLASQMDYSDSPNRTEFERMVAHAGRMKDLVGARLGDPDTTLLDELAEHESVRALAGRSIV